MKRLMLTGFVAFTASTGCLPLFITPPPPVKTEAETLVKTPTVVKKPTVPPVTVEQVNETNAQDIANRLTAELDRESADE